MLISGDPIAHELSALAAGIGRPIGPGGPNTIGCPIAIYKCLQQDAPALRRVWSLIGELSEGALIDNRLVVALFFVERKLADSVGRPVSLSDTLLLRRRLIDAGLIDIAKAMNESANYYKRGGAGVWARGVVNVLNYRCQRRYRLTVDDEKQD